MLPDHRIPREAMFLDMAEAASRRSTCFRGNTGALIVYYNDIVSMGYNGPPSGEEHCKGNDCEINPVTGGCQRSLHAEQNAINRAILKKADLVNCYLYTTSAPCTSCADQILHNNIGRIYFRYPYRDEEGLYKLISSESIQVFRVTTAGFIVQYTPHQNIIIYPCDEHETLYGQIKA